MENIGHLQHGQAPEPFRTERVRIRHSHADVWHAWYEGRYRLVHIQVKRTFIVYRGQRITIKIEGV